MKQIVQNKNRLAALILVVLILPNCSKKIENPGLISVVPAKGIIGDPVSISGTNLENAGAVTFNGKSSVIINNTPSQITAVVPENATIGLNKIVVQTGGGESGPLDFEVVETPTVIDSFPPVLEQTIPNSNYIDYPVLIYGQFLSGAISVSFDDVEAKISTNNQNVVTAIVPEGISSGPVKIKVRTIKGTSTLNFNVQGPPPDGVIPVNFSIVNIPPPSYVPLISNQWSCGLFSEEDGNTFVELNSDENFDGNFKITGNYEFHYDKNKNYNNLNFVEITNSETDEILAGQFSSEFENPCIYRMVLISSVTGLITECTVDVSEFGDCEN